MRKYLLTIALFVFWGGQSIAQVTGLAGWDIYLDPGHSRTENMGIYNYSEAEKNLRVSLNMLDILLSQTDIDTVWSSRYDDNVQVSLSQRTDEANSLGAAWYHSIHSNAGSPATNNTLMLWGQYRSGAEKIPNGGKAMSRKMIPLLTRAMRIATIGDFGDCSFYGCTFTGPYLHVNRNSQMPSELSEAGFHTSPLQNVRNMNADWKRMEAYAFYWAILEYHGIPRPPLGIAAGYIYDIERDRPLNSATIEIAGQTYMTDSYDSLFHKYTNDPELLQNGFYYFEGVPAGTHDMIISADNFESDTLTITVSDTFITFTDIDLVDSRPPFVTTTIPENNATDVDIFEPLTINFSRRMDPQATLDAISVDPPLNYSFIWQNSFRRLVLGATDMQQETQYTLTISAAAIDQFGHTLDGNGDGIGGDDFVLTFITQDADISPPQVSQSYPPLDGLNIELHPIINLEFDEEFDTATIHPNSVILENLDNSETVLGTLHHYVVGDRSVLSFFPGLPLQASTNYAARVQPGLKDLFGNEITSEIIYPFSTGTEDFQITEIDPFQDGILTNWWVPQQSGATTGILTNETSRGNNSTYFNMLSGSTRSMRLSYGWDTTAPQWLIREYLAGGDPRDVWFDDTYILQVYIFGDGSGTKFRFTVDDNVPNGTSSNHEVSQWTTIDWIGWRLVSWDLANDPIGSWIGNGVLEGTLRFDSFQLTYDNVNNSAETGQIYFDDMRLVKKVVVGIDDKPGNETLPKQHALFQNYPNPFNPETTIRYQIATPGDVRVTIYNQLGQMVKTLVNTYQTTGSYTVKWDGSNQNGGRVASGIYIYKLTKGEETLSRKMILMK